MKQGNISEVNFHQQSILGKVRNAVLEVYREVGTSNNDSLYEVCLRKEFSLQGIPYVALASLPCFYKGERIDAAVFGLFLLVEDMILIEVNSLYDFLESYEDSARDNLEVCGKQHCLLLNFKAEAEHGVIKHITA